MPNLREKKQEMLRNFNRSAIYDAAVELFKEYGFDGFTMQQVADRAEMAIGTLYNHFSNKEQIIQYVAESLFNKFYDSIKESTQGPTATQQLETFAVSFFSFSVANRSLINLFGRATDLVPSRAAKLAAILDILQSIVNDGIARKEFKSVDSLKAAEYIFSALVGYSNHVAVAREFDPVSEARGLIAFLKPSLAQ